MKTFIRTFAALAIASVLLLSLCSCGSSSVKLEDVVAVTIDGYNGHAKATLDIDYDAINAKINAKKAAKFYSKVNASGIDSEEDNVFYQLDSYAAGENYFNQFLTIETEEDYNTLSNGDEVVIVVKPREDLEEDGYTFRDIKRGLGLSIDEEMTYEVSGLETAKEVDMLGDAGRYVQFTGANGYGKAEIVFDEDVVFDSEGYYFSYYSESSLNVVRDNQSLGHITYSIATEEGKENGSLTKGDKITVSISDNSNILSLMETNGYIPAAESLSVTVPDLGTYLTSGDQITDKELAEMKAKVVAQINENYEEATMDGVLYASAKPQSVVSPEKKLMVVFVYTRPGFFGDHTEGIDISGIKRDSDGKLSYDIGDDYSLYDGMDSLSEDWTYTRVE